MRVLAADVGGTHARLAVFEGDGSRPRKVREEQWPSEDYQGLLPIVGEFLDQESGLPDAACLALAGPVRDGVCRLPNLGWEVDGARVAEETGIPEVRLINDFDAIGHGILVLRDDELALLGGGEGKNGPPSGHLAVVGAGTGLGMVGVDPSAEPPRLFDSEGGHSDFAPRNENEWALARFLAARHGRASWERVLSGDGLVDIYRFLRERGDADESAAVRAEMEEDDPAAVVSRHGLSRDDALCAGALGMFVSAYGAFAANVAMILGAQGGVYVAGGIAPQILEALKDGRFMASFHAMGRMRDYVERIPVRVVLNPDVGLLGSASVAVAMAADRARMS
ncbi:MAG: glucokinase [Gemmatimonadota bacterium]